MPTVRLREPLKRLAAGRSEHALAAGTVTELLKALEQSEPALTGWILDERGKLRPHINVFINGELGKPGDVLEDGDHVDVIPAISGGAPS
jgi:molybdopterin converting factor small subunit